MLRPVTLVLILAAAMVTAVDKVSLEAQTTAASQAPAIAVSITLQKDKVPLGQSPWVLLTVKNLTDELVMIEARPHVQGENGELFMRPEASIISERLQPRTPRLRTVVYVPWTIAPRETSTHKWQLAYLFDLSHRGQYTVYMEVMDPSSHKLLHTNSAKFEMQSPAR
jgi:hypothetical protein